MEENQENKKLYDNQPFKIYHNYRQISKNKQRVRRNSQNPKPDKPKKQRRNTVNLDSQHQQKEKIPDPQLKKYSSVKESWEQYIAEQAYVDKNIPNQQDDYLDRVIPFSCKEKELDIQSPFMKPFTSAEKQIQQELYLENNRQNFMDLE